MSKNESIQSQRIEYLCDNILSGVISMIIGIFIVAWVFYGMASDRLIYGWLLAGLFVSALRFWFYFYTKHHLLDLKSYPFIERLIVVTATLAGLFWGVGSILLCMSSDMFYWVFLVLLLSGYATGALFTMLSSLPACAGYFFFALSPIAAWFFFQDDTRAPLMGLLLIIFMAAMWNVSRNSRRILFHGYTLNVEKSELSNALRKQNKQLQCEISEHQKTSADLLKSEQSYRQLIEYAPLGILVFKQGKLLFSNQYWQALMHIPSTASEICMDIESLACESDRHALSELLDAHSRSELAVPITWMIPNASQLHTEVSSLEIRFNEENVTLLLIHEIESRIQAKEAERQKQENKAFALRLESLQTMAGGVAHDFNNLLFAMMGNASLAKSKYGVENNKLAEFLTEIEVAGERAAKLCQQMLAYSGHGAFVVERLNLSQLIQENVHKLNDMIEKNIEIQYQPADSIPCIVGDPRQLRQLLENLVKNAAEAYHGQAGSIVITTSEKHKNLEGIEKNGIGPLAAGEYIALSIQDTGCGMSAETIENIFNPFFTTKFAGRGLGMSAVFGIVRGLKGDLSIDSKEGEGTVVRILLPAISESIITSSHDVEVKQDEYLKDGGVILLVDDEQMIRKAGSMMLESFGFKVLTACDGLEAIEVYECHMQEIDLIILDMTMPRMGGKACLKKLHEINPQVRVIISSGYSMEDISIQLGESRPSAILQKPYTREVLR
ncbi:MAG: ATP-binding protein, partial [Mariprofundus sp.]